MLVDARVVTMVAEMRAIELLRALRAAVTGAPHWRLEGENLLMLVESGVPPARFREQFQQQLQHHKEDA
jgi:hypothetical protein